MFSSEFLGLALPLFSAATVAMVGVLTRATDDRLSYIALLNVTVAALGLPFLFVAPPLTAESTLLLLLSALTHWVYQLNMIRTLSLGELSLAFPIMRGLAPLIIAATSTLLLAEHLSALGWMGLVTATTAIVAFGLWAAPVIPDQSNAKLFRSAVVTAFCIAAYTVVDALGVRAMPKGEGWVFIVWFFVVGGIPTMITGWRAKSDQILAAFRTTWMPALSAGVLSFLSYGSALLAMEHAPIAHVAAMRESSVVFAALLGWLLLKEPFGMVRVGCAILLLGGLMAMKLS